VLALGVLVLAVPAACGGEDGAGASEDLPQVVVTTSILGDLVREVVGDRAAVRVIMPPGADPHEFAPSARQAEAMEEADLLVVNGAGFEQGLASVVAAARDAGTPTFVFADHVQLRPLDGDDHDHDGGDDPHVWTDPLTVVDGLAPLGEALAAIEGVDPEVISSNAGALAESLRVLDEEIATMLEAIPAPQRVLVTNHEALGYFAARYGFEVVGTVIPSQSTSARSSAAELEALARVIDEHGVPAIFAETTQPTQLAEALAADVDADVQVVALYTESLGEEGSGADTYVGMMRTNAERIVEALT
jgi:zinc/manganese transport system substrate-binding protein